MAKKRPICRWADLTPGEASKPIRNGQIYPCSYPVPDLPAMPASVTKHPSWSSSWPPFRSYVSQSDCAGCLCFKEKDQ